MGRGRGGHARGLGPGVHTRGGGRGGHASGQGRGGLGQQIPVVHFSHRDEFLSSPAPTPDLSKQLKAITLEPKLDLRILKMCDLRSDVSKYEAITPEMNKVVNEAMIGDPDEKVAGDVTRRDFWLLSGYQECNDLILDVFFKMVEKRSKETEGLKKMFSMNTTSFDKMGTAEGNQEIMSSFKVKVCKPTKYE